MRISVASLLLICMILALIQSKKSETHKKSTKKADSKPKSEVHHHQAPQAHTTVSPSPSQNEGKEALLKSLTTIGECVEQLATSSYLINMNDTHWLVTWEALGQKAGQLLGLVDYCGEEYTKAYESTHPGCQAAIRQLVQAASRFNFPGRGPISIIIALKEPVENFLGHCAEKGLSRSEVEKIFGHREEGDGEQMIPFNGSIQD